MLVDFQFFVLLYASGFVLSYPIKPHWEKCRTSTGELGTCQPLRVCPYAAADSEKGNKDRIFFIPSDLGCGFHKEIFVCCPGNSFLDTFEGWDNITPLSTDPNAPSTGFGGFDQSIRNPHTHSDTARPTQGIYLTGELVTSNNGNRQPVNQEFSVPNGPNLFDTGPTLNPFRHPNHQELGSNRPDSHGMFNQNGQGSFFSQGNADHNLFVNERPLSHNPDDGHGVTQNGFNNHRPSFNGGITGFGSFERPGSQGFGDIRPGNQFERPEISNFSSPNYYQSDKIRPNKRNQTLNGFDDFMRPSDYSGSGNRRPLDQINSGSHSHSNIGNHPYNNNDAGSKDQGSKRPKPQRPEWKNPQNNGDSHGRHPNRKLLPDGKCGTEISDKIIGGQETDLDEFPWMALLHFSTKSGQDRGFGCGGSLINERYVLTAAHCIKGASLPPNVVVKTVRLGEYDVTKNKDCINGVCSPAPIDAEVENIIVHPEYKPNDRGQHHDIALIRLKKKISFSTYISPICLPGENLLRKDYTGKRLIVAGWGKTANGKNGQSSAVKQKVSLPFVSLENCKPFYSSINIRLRSTQMCAGGEKAKDSCQGDSGGPLMSNEMSNGQSSWFVTGIVSFGPEDCGVKNIAGVYTKVSEYVDWILDNMRS